MFSEEPKSIDIEHSEKSYIRMKIIKRFGETWFFLFFWIFAYIVKINEQEGLEADTVCFGHLLKFLNLFFYGYVWYAGFLVITLIGCICTSLESLFRFVHIGLSLVFFFGLFIYDNYVMYNLPQECIDKTGDARVFALLYIIAWYTFLGTRVIMLIMYMVKRLFAGKRHDLEGMQLFVDVD